MELAFLKKLINKAPTGPGIYIFTGSGKEKLYIGKASNIKARLLSYLKTTDQRILQMLSRATGIKILETSSEIEALILESLYIKKYKPVFNIMLRDDKQFFYVGFTNETYPKIFLTHQPERVSSIWYLVSGINRGEILNTKYKIQNTYVGPFTDGTALKITLRYLRRIFPHCTCKKPHNNFCLNYHIGKCPGFCCLKNPNTSDKQKQQYRKNVQAIKDILSGKKTSLLKNLEKEMVASGKKEEFEKAIETRDKIEKIKRVFENAQIIQNYDISKNHSENILLTLKKALQLKRLPHRVEAYDVANIQGKYAVGAMVVFINGKLDKNEYRKFQIRRITQKLKSYLFHDRDINKTLQFTHGGDVGMLKEVLARRFCHPEWPMPDLILIDGGKSQLNAAIDALRDLRFKNKDLRIIALTKNEKHKGEKIFIAGEPKSIPLSQLPVSVKNLLLHINSEVHRFAVRYYRKLHRKSLK